MGTSALTHTADPSTVMVLQEEWKGAYILKVGQWIEDVKHCS